MSKQRAKRGAQVRMSILRQYGLEIVSERLAKGSHISVVAAYKGYCRMFTVSSGTGCNRSFINFEGDVKRFKRDVELLLQGLPLAETSGFGTPGAIFRR